MVEFYSPGHLNTVTRFCRFTPKWLLLGGAADADEGLTARRLWPGCRVLAFEPNPEAYRWQLDNVPEWSDPDSGMVLSELALADTDGEAVELVYEPGRLRNATSDPEALSGCRGDPGRRFVSARTVRLDSVNAGRGPVSDAVLWLDVEGYELETVRGGAGIMSSGAVRVLNVEVQARRKSVNRELERLMRAWRFRQVHRWNHSPSCEDRVYVRDL